jgi:hypothetical protein
MYERSAYSAGGEASDPDGNPNRAMARCSTDDVVDDLEIA